MKFSNLILFSVATLAAALSPPIPPGQAAAAAVDMGSFPRLDTHSLLTARSKVDLKCNSKQKSDIKNALEICRKIAKAAAAAARTGDAARLETYFHTSERAYRNRIAAVYDEIAQECKDGKQGQLTISCDASAAQCPNDPNTVAYYTRGTDTVTLCPAALTRPIKPKLCGDRSLAGVLIHEFSHALAANLVVDHRYGRYESTQLARDQGLANADTYQWFAIDVYLNCPAPTAPPTSTTALPLPSPPMSQGASSAAGPNVEDGDVEHLRNQQWHEFVQDAQTNGFGLETITDYLGQGLDWMQTNVPDLYGMLQQYPAAFNVLLHLGREGVALSACIRNKRPNRRAKRDPGQSEHKCKPVKAMLGQSDDLDVTQNSEKCVLQSPIKVQVKLSDATSAGSWDRLFLAIGHNPIYDNSQPHYLLKEAPAAGDLMSIDIDLADAYTIKEVTVNAIKYVRLVSVLDNGAQASNQLKLQDITITAKCAASSKVAELHKTVNDWFTDWNIDLKPADWSWTRDCSKFTSLQFKWCLVGAVSAGTWDSLKLSSHRDHKVTGHDIMFAQSPARNSCGKMHINLKDMYGLASVPIAKVDYFRAYSIRYPSTVEDQWEFGGMQFTAQCEGYDKAVILEKYKSDYNWHSHKNSFDMTITPSDWQWEDAVLESRHPFPRQEL